MNQKKILIFSLLLVFLTTSYFLFSKYRQNLLVQKTALDQKIITIQEKIAPQITSKIDQPLPSDYLIETAFVPQAPEQNWQQPWQDACEEAALLTVHYYYQGENPSISKMVKDLTAIFDYQNNQGWGHDINLDQLTQTATDLYGYKSLIIDDPQIDQIKEYLVKNYPVIVPAAGKILYQENKNFRSGGPFYHYLVILGYHDTSSTFTVHDVGTRHGAYFKYSYPLLLQSIHDLPETGQKEDILQGAKRVVVLLK